MESIGKTTKKLASCNFSRKMHEAPSVTDELELHQLMDMTTPNWMPS